MTLWARMTTARPWLTLATELLVVVCAGCWGLGVLDRLNLAGQIDPGSQSARADELIRANIGRQTPDVVVIYSAPPGSTLEDIRARVVERFDRVPAAALAKPIESYWTTKDPIRKSAMISTGGSKALAVLTLEGDDAEQLRAYQRLVPELTVPGIPTQFTGFSALTDDYNTESVHDVALAETVAFPVTLILLLFILGGLVAASFPVIVGGLTIFGSLGALRLISTVTDVSAFALNVAMVLGLGLAIDYGLLTVGRFREELGRGRTPVDAAQHTIRTAGRSIAFSALLMTCAFSGAIAAPISMLRSLGFGAMAAVDIAALLSLTAVPAVLALLGERVNALPWRRGAVQRSEERGARFWDRMAGRVLRRPVLIAVLAGGILLLLSTPLLGIRPAGIDINGLPEHSAVRIAQSTLTTEFPNATDGVTLIVRGSGGVAPTPQAVSRVMAAAQQCAGVRLVLSQAAGGDLVLLHVVLSTPDFTSEVGDTVAALRQLPAPPDITVLVGGQNAISTDSDAAVLRSFPIMLSVMLGATLLVMFAAFRSIVLPFKAVAMAMISLGATIGVLIWVIQDGHGAGYLGTVAAPLPFPALVVVIGAVFGLSTDYEVFLMSRMMEAHLQGATIEEAVRVGVSRTGRIITAAALLLTIVTGAVAFSDVSLLRVTGLGMSLAIIVDATVVRMLLVPALVKVMGRANWWLPRIPWARRGSRFGTEIADTIGTFPDISYSTPFPPAITGNSNIAVVPWRMTGTHLGLIEPPGFAATGKTVDLLVLDIWQFRSGLICRCRSIWDLAEMLQQLGIMPTCGSAAERAFAQAQKWRSKLGF
ncbi:MMPL family transporter [Nocardia sp. SYP-A9097]|uniref:MMPL family transporter n=1 Tax=Nocardia sp. SYP-A9097 TaxID=2663237 RepID=UPI00129A727A|nr:MMPL family transporter [Nocardia sp. SYP-A9097]MRH87972.1 MMPL family transporter [Nocardia sp. SYP-A9097]